MNTNANVVATFEDRYGDERRIHATRHGLKVQRQTSTVVLRLNREIAVATGLLIQAKRIERGYALEDLCRRAGLATATPKARMWEIENAKRKEGLTFGTLFALAIALECEPGDLLPPVAVMLSRASAGIRVEERLA